MCACACSHLQDHVRLPSGHRGVSSSNSLGCCLLLRTSNTTCSPNTIAPVWSVLHSLYQHSLNQHTASSLTGCADACPSLHQQPLSAESQEISMQRDKPWHCLAAYDPTSSSPTCATALRQHTPRPTTPLVCNTDQPYIRHCPACNTPFCLTRPAVTLFAAAAALAASSTLLLSVLT